MAGGPSLSLQQVRLLAMARASIRVVTINDSIYPCWFADVGYACDAKWWRHHGWLADFPGRRLSCGDTGQAGIDHLENTGTLGFDAAPGAVRTGGNSGYQALHLCAQLGARQILLIGYDMSGAPQDHWFGQHPSPIACRMPTHRDRISAFAELAAILRDLGVDVINCSPGSALNFFRAGDLGRELEAAMADTIKKAKPKPKPAGGGKKGAQYPDRQMDAGRGDYVKR